MQLATGPCLQNYIRYVCVYSGITCTGRSVKSCKMFSCGCTTFFLLCFLLFPPLKKGYLIRYPTSRKPGRMTGKWVDFGVVVYLKKESSTFSTSRHSHFLIRASRSLCQPSKRKSELPGKHTRGM